MSIKTAEQRRAIYNQFDRELSAHGWVHQRWGGMSGYTTFSRGREFLHMRFGHEVLRPTWVEYGHPRLPGQIDDLPAGYAAAGRLPCWYSRVLPAKGLTEAALALIACPPVTGPFLMDDESDETEDGDDE